MPHLIKPKRLVAGDIVATVSPSWGGPGALPQRYQAGKAALEQTFGVRVVEMPHTLAPPDWVAHNPPARADDLMAAFADPDISGIIATIGGEDCIRLLPFLDLGVIAANPKVFLGFSDTTALHLACYTAGVTSFYGPSIMAGFAENGGMHAYTADSVLRTLFSGEPAGLVPNNTEGWTVERTDWSLPGNSALRRKLHPADAPRILQGSGMATGHLLGGCVEVLEMAKGTAWWPDKSAWSGAILFLETSEEAPTASYIRHCLRNYAATGLLEGLAGLLIARADPGEGPGYQAAIEAAILQILAEAGRTDLPVLAGLDFGHTQPMLTLPYGVQARIDCSAATLTIVEAGVN
ncbi:LD-carboxypeptidase [Devosia oryziradicis]|uniref:LD-carboxypeptidase n=1 Tax=Devosia oryziradicis TaxID=2801335 RepID=A0ABX7BTE0_9HYPH|nr:S66 peptidase family protein [Devosia oryziradicis]QQR35224.1 LD-carboxypeptidase [Devosia oryziradicis]